VIEAM
jgi:hypothetical protein